MKVHFYRYRNPFEAELTVFLGRLQFRVSTHQLAAWWCHDGNRFTTLFDTGRRAGRCRP